MGGAFWARPMGLLREVAARGAQCLGTRGPRGQLALPGSPPWRLPGDPPLFTVGRSGAPGSLYSRTHHGLPQRGHPTDRVQCCLRAPWTHARMPWVDSDLKRFLVPGPRPHCGLLLWRSLRHHHPQVLPGPPQRSHGEEPHSLQPRRPLPHHLLHQPQPPADGARQHPGPLAAQAQLHSLQPGQPSLHRAYEFLPDGPAASEVLSRQDGHGASSPLLCAAREGAGTVPPPHRPASSVPEEEVAPFKTSPREPEDLPDLPIREEGLSTGAEKERLLL
ncbi:ciliary microtubule inner protein 2C isoform X4 [Pan paniscus]|nr:protein FAM166C isoform X4 [Pan paniscus]